MEFLGQAAAVIMQDGKLLLIKRGKECHEAGKWCTMNETIEEEEMPEEAAVRGAKEELGVDFEVGKKLFEHFCNGHTTHVFSGNFSGEIRPDKREVEEWGWFDYEETKGLVFAYDYNKVVDKLFELGLIQ
ncbi:MAG: NUDIX hydrolase [Patescibacteria group bacterium]